MREKIAKLMGLTCRVDGNDIYIKSPEGQSVLWRPDKNPDDFNMLRDWVERNHPEIDIACYKHLDGDFIVGARVHVFASGKGPSIEEAYCTAIGAMLLEDK